MREEIILVNEVRNFLEKLTNLNEIIDINRLKYDKDYFTHIYKTLKNNLVKLKELKNRMEDYGFDSTFFPLDVERYSPLQQIKKGFKREDIENQKDVARHKIILKESAMLKKSLYEQTKASISSHNIALGHLEELGYVECRHCGKIIKGNDVIKVIEKYGKIFCPKCYNENVIFKANPESIYRIELLKHLPYDGRIEYYISQLEPIEKIIYRRIIKILREKKRGSIKSVTVVFRVKKNGSWILKKQQIFLDKDKNFEEILRKKYKDVVIEKVKYHFRRSLLVSGKFNRQVLVLTYIRLLSNYLQDFIDTLIKKHGIDIGKLSKFEKLKRALDRKLLATTYAIDQRIIDEREELLRKYEEELRKEGFIDEKGNIVEDLEKALEFKKKLRKLATKFVLFLIAWDLFKFFLIKPYRERRYAGIFPGLQPVPDISILKKVLKVLSSKIIPKVLEKYLDEKFYTIKDAHEVINKKFEIEKLLENYLKVISSRAVGATVLYLYTDLDLNDVEKVLNVKKEDIKDVLKIIIRLGKKDIIPEEKIKNLEDVKNIKVSEKALEFLKLVKTTTRRRRKKIKESLE